MRATGTGRGDEGMARSTSILSLTSITIATWRGVGLCGVVLCCVRQIVSIPGAAIVPRVLFLPDGLLVGGMS